MQPAEFTEGKAGRLIKSPHDYWAFVPDPLPPSLQISWELVSQICAAERGLSELAGITRTLPNPHLLIRPFMSREAVLSSRIEGTQASLSDLFFFEAAGTPPKPGSDAQEVQNYVRALEHGLKRLDELPVCLRLLKEMHKVLMTGVRGEHLTPGEFRRSQNWIGPPGCTLNEAKFVPPPPEEMMEILGELEKYLHKESPLPLVVRLALVHYHFEAIHPFLDGNGRIGRLLVILLLCTEKALPKPMLYLSAYFERNRKDYYRLLLAVSQEGDWLGWISFFLQGIAEQSRDAIARSERLLELWQKYRRRLQSVRSSALLLRLVDELFSLPYLNIGRAKSCLKVTYRSAQLNVQKLVDAGILKEMPGRKYNRIFIASEILKILEAPEVKQSGN